MAKKTCFVIGPIGKPQSDIRKWADTIFEHIIKPAVKECGYEEPCRADYISSSGMITVEIMEHLIKDTLVIADLTNANANVYYELAVRHAIRNPFVQLIRDGEESPFDTKDLRTIKVNTEIDVASRAIKELKKFIPEAEKKGRDITTPISLVVDLELMKASGNAQQKTLADVLAKIENIRSIDEETNRRVEKILTQLLGIKSQLDIHSLGAARDSSYLYPLRPIQEALRDLDGGITDSALNKALAKILRENEKKEESSE